tara:strand:- start:209 stop:667 length:459 start_codon:yes stop_codon:yes gene_type:complete
MLEILKNIFSSPEKILDKEENNEALEKAISSLMIEAAMADGNFSEDEKVQIKTILGDLFSFDDCSIDNLIEETELNVKQSTQLYGFSKILKDQLEYEKRLEIIQMMWEVCYADGELDEYEANLIRRVSGLLYITDVDCGSARKNAINHLGLK